MRCGCFWRKSRGALLLAALFLAACARKAEPAHSASSRNAKYGRLPPEEIQRVVRDHYTVFRYCYEKALADNPRLEGRVAVSFVIELDGTVGKVEDHGSTLPDANAVQCIVNAYRKLVFPKPEGGTVTVVYPIEFSPG